MNLFLFFEIVFVKLKKKKKPFTRIFSNFPLSLYPFKIDYLNFS